VEEVATACIPSIRFMRKTENNHETAWHLMRAHPKKTTVLFHRNNKKKKKLNQGRTRHNK
jgi:hypothetical protein